MTVASPTHPILLEAGFNDGLTMRAESLPAVTFSHRGMKLNAPQPLPEEDGKSTEYVVLDIPPTISGRHNGRLFIPRRAVGVNSTLMRLLKDVDLRYHSPQVENREIIFSWEEMGRAPSGVIPARTTPGGTVYLLPDQSTKLRPHQSAPAIRPIR